MSNVGRYWSFRLSSWCLEKFKFFVCLQSSRSSFSWAVTRSSCITVTAGWSCNKQVIDTFLSVRCTLTCCLLPLRVSMTNCMVSLMSESPSLMHGCPPPPFFSWLFSCRGMATSSWCTFTVSPLRCCRDAERNDTVRTRGDLRSLEWFKRFHTCRFSSIILSRAWMKSSSSAHATCFSPPPRMVTSFTNTQEVNATERSLGTDCLMTACRTHHSSSTHGSDYGADRFIGRGDLTLFSSSVSFSLLESVR